MFEQIEKGRGLLVGTRVGAIILGALCFIPVFFLSLIITVPFSKWYWAGNGQNALGAMALSFWMGIAGSLGLCAFFLKRVGR